MRLRHLVTIGPRPPIGTELHPDADVTFVPMEAIADGLGGLDISQTRPFSEVVSGSYNYFAEGDLLLAKVTPCFENGKKALAQSLSNGIGYATSEVHVIRPGVDRIHPKYLFYLLCSEDFRAGGIASMTGAGGLRRVSDAAVLNYQPSVTNLPTQKAIADFLDRETARIDQLIEKKQRMVEVLGEKRQAVISRAVTKGLDADVPMKDSGVVWLGDIPVHWDVKQLRRAIMFRRGHDLPTDEREEGEVVIVSSSGVSSTHSRATAKAPGIVTGRYGTIGQFHLINQDYWPLNTTLYSINLYGNEPRFLLYMLAHMSPQFLAHAVKSAVPGVDRKDVHADHVAVPPISEQRAIAAFLDRETVRIDTLVTKIRETIDRLREFRSALITAAVTGQIDVSTWSNQGTSDRRLDQIEEATSGTCQRL